MMSALRVSQFASGLIAVAVLILSPPGSSADWPMLGLSATRNSVVVEAIPPTDWDVSSGRNIKWTAQLGTSTFATPVVGGGRAYIGTNNGAGYLPRYPSTVDLGCMLCFQESDGAFLWQYSAEKLPIGFVQDWPLQGLVSSPLVEGDRLWFVSNRHVVVCLDAEGFRDGENDGPWKNEPAIDSREADVLWQFDLIQELGVFPHPPGMGPNSRCSIAASHENRIFVVTGNGTDNTWVNIPAPDAPSLVCIDKDTGKVLWTDASPGKNILDCQASHPLVAEIDGKAQVIVPQGDGWIRSFDASTGELLWKFDINPKQSRWTLGGGGTRNNVLATPVLYEGRVYIASGQQAEHGDGIGRLVCIDPTRRGDISSELALDRDGHALPHRRVQAVDPARDERTVPNPRSGLVWEFAKSDGEDAFLNTMHRTMSSVAIHEGLVVAADFTGCVHCLDADTGRKHWTYDAFSAIWSTPLIVGDTIYVTDEEGNVSLLRLSADPKVAFRQHGESQEPIAKFDMQGSIMSSPIYANDVLYVATRSKLHAITATTAKSDPPRRAGDAEDTRLRNRDGNRVARSVFAPTPEDVVEQMLAAVGVGEQDTVIDLGSGDGRILIAAAKKHGARAIGYEIDAALVDAARANVKQAGVAERVDVRHQDMYSADLSSADVVTVFLYPATLQALRPSFAKLKAGAWLVSHHYEIPGATPDKVIKVPSKETGNEHNIFVYAAPLAR